MPAALHRQAQASAPLHDRSSAGALQCGVGAARTARRAARESDDVRGVGADRPGGTMNARASWRRARNGGERACSTPEMHGSDRHGGSGTGCAALRVAERGRPRRRAPRTAGPGCAAAPATPSADRRASGRSGRARRAAVRRRGPRPAAARSRRPGRQTAATDAGRPAGPGRTRPTQRRSRPRAPHRAGSRTLGGSRTAGPEYSHRSVRAGASPAVFWQQLTWSGMPIPP